MSWPVGVTKQKTGGRAPGTPNKRTLVLADKLDMLGFDPVAELVRTIPDLEPKDRVSASLHLLQFVYPRRKAIEITNEPDDVDHQKIEDMISELKRFGVIK